MEGNYTNSFKKLLPGDLFVAGFVQFVVVVDVVVVAAAAAPAAAVVVAVDAAAVAVAAAVVVAVAAVVAVVVTDVFAAAVETAAGNDAGLHCLGTMNPAAAASLWLVYLLKGMDVEMHHPSLSKHPLVRFTHTEQI